MAEIKNYAVSIADRTGVNLNDVRKVINVLLDSDDILNAFIEDRGGRYLDGQHAPVRALINAVSSLDNNIGRMFQARLRGDVTSLVFDEKLDAITDIVNTTRRLSEGVGRASQNRRSRKSSANPHNQTKGKKGTQQASAPEQKDASQPKQETTPKQGKKQTKKPEAGQPKAKDKQPAPSEKGADVAQAS
jgi:hypothetical protein